MEFEWTRVYFGVTHIKNIPKRYQITVSDIQSNLPRAYMLDRESDMVFNEIREYFGTLENCKFIAEEWADQIIER